MELNDTHFGVLSDVSRYGATRVFWSDAEWLAFDFLVSQNLIEVIVWRKRYHDCELTTAGEIALAELEEEYGG